jgi:hypothetical protein
MRMHGAASGARQADCSGGTAAGPASAHAHRCRGGSPGHSRPVHQPAAPYPACAPAAATGNL